MGRLARITKAYDIRGRVPDDLDADLAERLGRAAARELGGPELVLGRDMRETSGELADAFAAGVRAVGVDVADLGLASADMVSFASGRRHAAGVMVTASHNPPAYNGFKFCRPGAEPVSLDTGLADIRDGAASPPAPAATPGGYRSLDLWDAYVAAVRAFAGEHRLAGLHAAVDAGHGMAGLVVPRVLDDLGVTLEGRYLDLDGSFPAHPPDPTDPANLEELQALVRACGAHVGFAFDGDADRVVCVDEAGTVISPSVTAAIIAARLLAREPGATVLHNVICSRVVPETIRARSGRAVATRVGHSYVKATMRETGAVFGGEHSGHYYFRDFYGADSAAVAMMVVLDALAETDTPMSVLAAPYDLYASSGEVSVAVDDPDAALAQAAALLGPDGHVDRTDGFTVDAGTWWLNLRLSNTESLVRLNVEAADAARMEDARDRALAVLAPFETTRR
ncbi:phosphomannomutase/phosphoglucomutase [Egibacter rhizosphaerae]|uniref:Phosphomannomutase/phosphoglucomutase n=1 Tax=Egibacter rhizosphaerae TaxID=1670831 RepID=A0A411YDC3_9ACTN|nr:phosphomannomutase/phosphoglucomutase [Egibacter rhizosphaerae]QBI19205.1 phosphomannomutase/phosphoglucomutase [Egibacter rhizosphaerae]